MLSIEKTRITTQLLNLGRKTLLFHINPKTGEPGKCRARYKCPYGNESAHSEDPQVLRKTYEEFMEDLQNRSKSVQFHFSTDSELDAFSNGDCAHLAKALARKTGGSLVVLSDDEDFERSLRVDPGLALWDHMAVRLNDGRILDVSGLWTEKEISKEWSWGDSQSRVFQIDAKYFNKLQEIELQFGISPIKTSNKITKILKDSGIDF